VVVAAKMCRGILINVCVEQLGLARYLTALSALLVGALMLELTLIAPEGPIHGIAKNILIRNFKNKLA